MNSSSSFYSVHEFATKPQFVILIHDVDVNKIKQNKQKTLFFNSFFSTPDMRKGIHTNGNPFLKKKKKKKKEHFFEHLVGTKCWCAKKVNEHEAPHLE